MITDSQKESNPINSKTNDANIDILALLWVILRGWKVILLLAILGLIIGMLYGRYVNPTFKSDALIQIEEKSSGIPALGSDISDLVALQASKAQTETELIRSRMILEPVVNLLNLSIGLSDPEIGYVDRIKSNRTPTKINTIEGVNLQTEDGQAEVSQFNVSQGYLDQGFTLVKSESGFTLSNSFEEFKGQLNKAHQFKGVDGQIQITVTELPINSHPVIISKQSLQRTTDSINSSLTVGERGQKSGIIQLSMTGHNQQQTSLILAQIVNSYINQNQSRGTEETTKTIAFIETQIPLLKEKLEDSETIFNDFRKKNATIDVSTEAEILLSENAQINLQLNELKLKKADLTTYYTEEHPLVIQINDQLKVLNARKQEIDNTITGLPEVQREFLKLSQDTEINREIYLTLLKNYEQLKIVKAGQVGFARVIDLPISTYQAIAPKKQLIMMLVTLLGVILGMLLVLLQHFLKNTVKDPDRLEAKTGVPVIATIPRAPSLSRLSKNKDAPGRLLAYTDSNSLSYEAIKSLRTHLMFGIPDLGKAGSRAKVILISGESPGVGKSFVSANLTEVLAQLNKKVLIIDADMRLGELHTVFNMSQDSGLADYLSNSNELLQSEDGLLIDDNLANFVHPTAMDNIDFIPRGKEPHNPTTLLAGEKFNELMSQLNAHYDYIVIDSPPILAASDAVILSQYADKVLIVTRHNTSIEGQLVYAINQLAKANIQVDGIILNDIQQSIMNNYSYHYSYAYGNNNK